MRPSIPRRPMTPRAAAAAFVAVALCAIFAMPAQARVARPPLPQPMPEIIRAGCPGLPDAAGCYVGIGETDESGRDYPTGAVYIHRGAGRFAVQHELGHAFDDTMLDAGERQKFARMIGMGDLLWTWYYDLGDGVTIQGSGTPAELFADAYAACRLGMERKSGALWETAYGYDPRPRQHRRICGMIARAGRDFGQPVAHDGDR